MVVVHKFWRAAGGIVLCAALLIVTNGCGGEVVLPTSSPEPSTPSSPASSSIDLTSPTPDPTDLTSPTPDLPTPSASPSLEPSPNPTSPTVTPSSSSSAPSATTPELDPSGSAARVLAKGDFFNVTDEWSEDRWEVPKVGEVTGLGTEIGNCHEPAMLEFRADGSYRRMSLKAAPGRQTQDSDQRLVVGVYDNEDFIDRIIVPYGKVGQLKNIDISGVSALRIRVSLETENCDSKSVFAVIYDVSVS